MNLDAYLGRIDLRDRPPPTLEGLRTVHRAHLRAIPYENLDVQLGRPVVTDPKAAYGKIVERRRGGWCYEMNGLFGWALEALGFRVTRVAGSVMREVMGDAHPGNHLVLKVELEEGLHLADVGFGDGPWEPIAITAGPFSSAGFPFSLAKVDDSWWRMHNHPLGGAKSFDFTLARADEVQLAAMSTKLQTEPWSPFVQNLVCQRYTENGITILRGRVVREVTSDGARDRVLENEEAFVRFLREAFALDVPEAAALWPRICARHEEVQARAP